MGSTHASMWIWNLHLHHIKFSLKTNYHPKCRPRTLKKTGLKKPPKPKTSLAVMILAMNPSVNWSKNKYLEREQTVEFCTEEETTKGSPGIGRKIHKPSVNKMVTIHTMQGAPPTQQQTNRTKRNTSTKQGGMHFLQRGHENGQWGPGRWFNWRNACYKSMLSFIHRTYIKQRKKQNPKQSNQSNNNSKTGPGVCTCNASLGEAERREFLELAWQSINIVCSRFSEEPCVFQRHQRKRWRWLPHRCTYTHINMLTSPLSPSQWSASVWKDPQVTSTEMRIQSLMRRGGIGSHGNGCHPKGGQETASDGRTHRKEIPQMSKNKATTSARIPLPVYTQGKWKLHLTEMSALWCSYSIIHNRKDIKLLVSINW